MRPPADCSLCGLCDGRTQIVYPDGNMDSGIVFVGEAPGENEDIEGRPFVGKSGKILSDMMMKHGFSRRDVLITNTVKCRPPGNRDPTPAEMDACKEFLTSELSSAKLVIGLGKNAVRDITGYDGPMDRVVNIPVKIDIGGREIEFIPTYHPAATIYNKESRRQLDMTMEIVAERLRAGMRFGGFVLDMDGTVYLGGVPIPGAKEFVSFLREKKIPFVFLTNNSSHTRRYYAERLIGMGFDATEDDILTSTVATAEFLVSRRFGKTVYPLASPEVIAELDNAGVCITEENPDIVLLTFDRTVTYGKINKAYRFLKDGAEFIATHPDDLCPTEDGYDIDIGPFIRMFEQMCQTRALVIGKPNRLMLEMAARRMSVPVSDTVMVGDRLYTDMEMARNAGTQSVLVLSGETDREMLEASDLRPTAVLPSVADIPKLIADSASERQRTRSSKLWASLPWQSRSGTLFSPH